MRTFILKKKQLGVQVVVWGLIWLVLAQLVGAIMIEANSNPPQPSLQSSPIPQPIQIFTNDQTNSIIQTTFTMHISPTPSPDSTNANPHQFNQPRLLSSCSIQNCSYCIITNSAQFCITCSSPYQPDASFKQCTVPNNNYTSPITSICTITNCNFCQNITLGIKKQQICVQCITDYRFLIFQGKCYPKSQLNDSVEITSYDTYYYLCQEGCKTCQPSTTIEYCYTCMDGYAMIENAYTCIKCKGFCKTCQYYKTAFCLTCYPGYALNSNNECVQCGTEHCKVCDLNNTNTCTQCISGYYLNNNQCFECYTTCQNCDNSTTQCSACQPGTYSATTNSSINCLSCIYGCMYCANITFCSKCYPGYFLNSSNQCEACKVNCWDCQSASDCKECLIGYDLFNNKCIKAKDNCVLMNQDGTCKFCKSAYSQINGSCVFNKNDTSIVTMACMYGMFAQSYWCYFCNNTFPNCYQCNSGFCLKCFDGYYLEASSYQCVQCSFSGCAVCESSNVCSQCLDGFYLSQFSSLNGTIESNGVCYPCDTNCKTCTYNSKYCTTCNDTHTLSQQLVCESSNRFYINMTLDFDYKVNMDIVDAIKSNLKTMTNNTNSTSAQQNIKFLSIRTGSTVINVEVYEQNADDLKANLQILGSNLVNGSTIGGVTLVSVLFSQSLPSQPPTPTPTPPVNNLPIILGTVLGGVGLIIIVIIICCCYSKRKKQNHNQDEKKPSTEGETVDENEQENQTPQLINKSQQQPKNEQNKQNKSEEKFIDSNVRPGEELNQGKVKGKVKEKLFNPYTYI